MKAGLELDALVAEKVMGEGPITWRRYAPADQDEDFDPLNIDTYKSPEIVECGPADEGAAPYGKDWITDYSTDLASAWQVVERSNAYFQMFNNPIKRIWAVKFEGMDDFVAADSAPLAICLAALQAVGVKQ